VDETSVDSGFGGGLRKIGDPDFGLVLRLKARREIEDAISLLGRQAGRFVFESHAKL
jgi:hypothetical protein